MDNITPKKCLIVGSGVQNHKEYVDLVKERIGDMLPVQEDKYTRTPSQYVGGSCSTWAETPDTCITLAFESRSWGH